MLDKPKKPLDNQGGGAMAESTVLEIRQITDPETILKTLQDPHIVSMCCPEDMVHQIPEIVTVPGYSFIGVYEGETYLGLFIAHYLFGEAFVHACLLPSAYGEKSRRAGLLFEQWLWEHMNPKRVIAQVADFNPLAVRYLKDLGFTFLGKIHGGWLHNGIDHDSDVYAKARC